MYTDFNNAPHTYNCIMGMKDINSIVPVYIHSLVKIYGFGDGDYSGVMSILQRTTYNNVTVESEWKKIMELPGYETGLVIDNSGVAENFMNTIHDNYYKQIQLK